MILFHFLYVAPKQDYLHSIHFHSFPFLYFKTYNQGYLISFNSIFFHSFHLLKYISFHSIPFLSIPLWSFHSISFLYELPNGALGNWLLISCKNLLGELINFKYLTIWTNIYIYIYSYVCIIKWAGQVVAGWQFFNHNPTQFIILGD